MVSVTRENNVAGGFELVPAEPPSEWGLANKLKEVRWDPQLSQLLCSCRTGLTHPSVEVENGQVVKLVLRGGGDPLKPPYFRGYLIKVMRTSPILEFSTLAAQLAGARRQRPAG